MNFPVIFPDGEVREIQLKTKELKGKYLISQVFSVANIIDDEISNKHFGLRYSDKDDAGKNWITPELNLRNISYMASNYHKAGSNIQFLVRFFPKSPELVFPTPESRVLFRQHMKNMLVNEEIGCDFETHAKLDALILQCNYGDFSQKQDLKDYLEKFRTFEIYPPTYLSCGTSVSPQEYNNLVQKYHKNLYGMRKNQANIIYLNEVQKLPLYGCIMFNICDKSHESYHLAISDEGLFFIYDSYLEIYTYPKKTEEYSWTDLIYSELENNIIKLGFFPQFGGFTERKIKIKSKYSHNKEAHRLQTELNNFKAMFTDVIDGQTIFDSRKKAQKFYTTLIPQKQNNTLTKKVSSLKLSLRNSLRRSKPKANLDHQKQIPDSSFTTLIDERPIIN